METHRLSRYIWSDNQHIIGRQLFKRVYIKSISKSCQPIINFVIQSIYIESLYYLDIPTINCTNKTGRYMESYENPPFQPVFYEHIVNQIFVWLTTFSRGIYNRISDFLSAVIPTFSRDSSRALFRYVFPWPQSICIYRLL